MLGFFLATMNWNSNRSGNKVPDLTSQLESLEAGAAINLSSLNIKGLCRSSSRSSIRIREAQINIVTLTWTATLWICNGSNFKQETSAPAIKCYVVTIISCYLTANVDKKVYRSKVNTEDVFPRECGGYRETKKKIIVAEGFNAKDLDWGMNWPLLEACYLAKAARLDLTLINTNKQHLEN